MIGRPRDETSWTAAASDGRDASSLSAALVVEGARVARRECAELVEALLDVGQHVAGREGGQADGGEAVEVRDEVPLELGCGHHHP